MSSACESVNVTTPSTPNEGSSNPSASPNTMSYADIEISSSPSVAGNSSETDSGGSSLISCIFLDVSSIYSYKPC